MDERDLKPHPEIIHVLPRFEGERAHEESSSCWCAPVPLEDEPRVIVHNRVAEA